MLFHTLFALLWVMFLATKNYLFPRNGLSFMA